MTSPTQRTLAECRRLGLTPWVVETWQAFWCGKTPDGCMKARGGVRRDMLGFIDVLALGPGAVYAIQTTEGGHSAERRTKIETEPTCEEGLAACIGAGIHVEVWGWSKCGAAGKRKLWTLRRERLVGPGTWVEIDREPTLIPLVEDEQE